MPLSVSKATLRLRVNRVLNRLAVLAPILDSVSLILLPSLLALFIAAALVGHGKVSAETLLEVLDFMARASICPAECP